MSLPVAGHLEIVRLTSAHVDGLLTLLRCIEEEGTNNWFQPHAFTCEHLSGLCRPDMNDLYYIATVGSSAIGYGLLRGWDEGYEVPSLGIAIHPDHRGLGLGRSLMTFLHSAARLRGSPRVRLRVYDENAAAIALYRTMGYRFEETAGSASGRLLVGFKEL